MGCFHPLSAYQSINLKTNGKAEVIFKPPNARHLYKLIELPCNQCIGCRLERSRQWAIRCHHEASLHRENCFITLTYDNENLPEDGSINVRHFQLFMKKLRKKYPNNKIRYFHCGEYGENLGRPHYHACLFGFDFEDKTFHNEHNNQKYYISETLNKIWGKGHCIIGDVTFESAAYCARYIMKKITGEDADTHYESINTFTGEITRKLSEYTTMSRRPGIGRNWLDKFKTDVYPSDEIIINGKQVRPPKFYDSQYEIDNFDGYTKIKLDRVQSAKENKHDNTPERRRVKEIVVKSKIKQLKRAIHDN